MRKKKKILTVLRSHANAFIATAVLCKVYPLTDHAGPRLGETLIPPREVTPPPMELLVSPPNYVTFTTLFQSDS